MKGLYRGFCRNENGTETIVLNGEKIKGDWVQGFLATEYHIIDDTDSFTYFGGGGMDGFAKFVIPETVCEAVRGVNDINGKQIFECDVIEDNYSTWEVKFNYEHSGFGAYFFNCEQRQIGKEMAQRFEVIGTIFDEKFEQGVEKYHLGKSLKG